MSDFFPCLPQVHVSPNHPRVHPAALPHHGRVTAGSLPVQNATQVAIRFEHNQLLLLLLLLLMSEDELGALPSEPVLLLLLLLLPDQNKLQLQTSGSLAAQFGCFRIK